MADIVNLRGFRKTRERAARAEDAARRRAAFGRTAAEREASAAAQRLRDLALDQHRLDPPDGGPAG